MQTYSTPWHLTGVLIGGLGASWGLQFDAVARFWGLQALSWSLDWAPYYHPKNYSGKIDGSPDSTFQDGMSTAVALARLQRLAAEQKANGTAAKPFFMAVGLHKPREGIPTIQLSARPPPAHLVLAATKNRFRLYSDQRWARHGCKRRHRWAVGSLIPATAMPHALSPLSPLRCRHPMDHAAALLGRADTRRQDRHRASRHPAGRVTAPSASLWTISSVYGRCATLAYAPCVTCPTWCLHSADADGCLHSDAVSKLGLQV